MKTCAASPEERASAKRRSFPRSASTLDRFFSRRIQAGSRWQSSQYIQEHQ